MSENEKTEVETPVVAQNNEAECPKVPPASQEINEARASSEERAGSGASPVRRSRGSRTTPRKRTESKGGDKKVDTIPEEEPENGKDVEKDAVEEKRL